MTPLVPEHPRLVYLEHAQLHYQISVSIMIPILLMNCLFSYVSTTRIMASSGLSFHPRMNTYSNCFPVDSLNMVFSHIPSSMAMFSTL
jgi:hypothetical protein